MWLKSKKFIRFAVAFLIFFMLNKQIYENAVSSAKSKRRKIEKSSRQREQQNFHEVDAFGDDFVDFGAQTGEHGQFSWHADFPLE